MPLKHGTENCLFMFPEKQQPFNGNDHREDHERN
jgi:hypothetical protein